MPDRINLSVVMPSFNEEKAIAEMIKSIQKNTVDYNTEILIVDSSKDQTPVIAKEMGAKVISQLPQGHGMALRTAITSASGDIIITSDCDNTYPMEKIPEFIELLINKGYDVVSGNRLSENLKETMPLSNRIGNWVFAFIVRLLYRIPAHDVTTGMFGLKKNVVHSIRWETNYSFPSEIIIRSSLNGFKYTEIPIDYNIRIGEVTLNKWRSGKAYIRCFLKYKWFKKIPTEKL